MPHPLSRRIHDLLSGLEVHDQSVVVGLSGGVDSVVLLHLMLSVRLTLNVQLGALHVHHGFSPNADQWTVHCTQLCEQWQVPLTVHRVHVDKQDPNGVEAAARTARYACYREVSARYVALAHHEDDQAETVLLQMLRGAGVAGIAAMPLLRALDDQRQLLRPLLSTTRDELVKYARTHDLRWIEDESNDDVSYRRNFVRRNVLPMMASRFRGYRTALGRVANNAADAAALLDVLGEQDLLAARAKEGIDILKLRALGEARAANVLRVWLGSRGVRAPNRDTLLELFRQATRASPDAQMSVRISGWYALRYRDVLMLKRDDQAHPQWEKVWRGEPAVALPDGRTLYFDRVTGTGLACDALERARVSIAYRQGGERLSVAANRPHRTLKNLLQESRIPPWERNRLPLVFVDDRLVWVHGVGMDPAFRASDSAMGFQLEVRGTPNVIR